MYRITCQISLFLKKIKKIKKSSVCLQAFFSLQVFRIMQQFYVTLIPGTTPEFMTHLNVT